MIAHERTATHTHTLQHAILHSNTHAHTERIAHTAHQQERKCKTHTSNTYQQESGISPPAIHLPPSLARLYQQCCHALHNAALCPPRSITRTSPCQALWDDRIGTSGKNMMDIVTNAYSNATAKTHILQLHDSNYHRSLYNNAQQNAHLAATRQLLAHTTERAKSLCTKHIRSSTDPHPTTLCTPHTRQRRLLHTYA
jgi:hypothetical protein